MRKCFQWVLPLVVLASASLAVHAFHHNNCCVTPVPMIGTPVFGGQSLGVQSFTVQSYGVQSFPVQSFGVQSYSLVPMGLSSQGLEAQGIGTDLATTLLSRLLQGGLNPGNVGGSSSSVVTELQNNTAALRENTAALKALTQAVKDNTNSDGSSPAPSDLKQLNPLAGVNANSFRAQDLDGRGWRKVRPRRRRPPTC